MKPFVISSAMTLSRLSYRLSRRGQLHLPGITHCNASKKTTSFRHFLYGVITQLVRFSTSLYCHTNKTFLKLKLSKSEVAYILNRRCSFQTKDFENQNIQNY